MALEPIHENEQEEGLSMSGTHSVGPYRERRKMTLRSAVIA